MDFLLDAVKEKGIVKIIMDYKKFLEWAEIIEKNGGEWDYILLERNLPEDFINYFLEELSRHSFKWLLEGQRDNLSEDTINDIVQYAEKKKLGNFSFDHILIYQTVSEEFIERHSEVLDWGIVCKYQKLSVPFMRKFEEKLYWSYVSKYQILDKDFILDFSHLVYWPHIFDSQDCITQDEVYEIFGNNVFGELDFLNDENLF